MFRGCVILFVKTDSSSIIQRERWHSQATPDLKLNPTKNLCSFSAELLMHGARQQARLFSPRSFNEAAEDSGVGADGALGGDYDRARRAAPGSSSDVSSGGPRELFERTPDSSFEIQRCGFLPGSSDDSGEGGDRHRRLGSPQTRREVEQASFTPWLQRWPPIPPPTTPAPRGLTPQPLPSAVPTCPLEQGSSLPTRHRRTPSSHRQPGRASRFISHRGTSHRII